MLKLLVYFYKLCLVQFRVLNLVCILIFVFVEISFILIFRDFYLQKRKKTELTTRFVCRKRKKNRIENSVQVFFCHFRMLLQFLEQFWYDFCSDDIFCAVLMIFRCEFFWIFGAIWNSSWILELIFYFYFYAQFGDRKIR